MPERAYYRICVAMLSLASLGVGVAALRGLGPPEVVRLLAPLGRAPLILGTVVPHVAYCVAHALPGGRRQVLIGGPGHDGWLLVLTIASLGSVLSGFSAGPGGGTDALAVLPYTVVSSGLVVLQAMRLRRPAESPR